MPSRHRSSLFTVSLSFVGWVLTLLRSFLFTVSFVVPGHLDQFLIRQAAVPCPSFVRGRGAASASSRPFTWRSGRARAQITCRISADCPSYQLGDPVRTLSHGILVWSSVLFPSACEWGYDRGPHSTRGSQSRDLTITSSHRTTDSVRRRERPIYEYHCTVTSPDTRRTTPES